MIYAAPVLKVMALHWLRAQHPDAVLACELGLGSYGSGGSLDVAAITPAGIVDVAAITPAGIVGVEVKGVGDSHARLELQGERYATVCRHMWLLPAPALEKACRKHKPRAWGLLTIDEGGQRPLNRAPWILGDHSKRNCPAVLWEMLWAAEKREVIADLCALDERMRAHAKKIHDLSEHIPLAALRSLVLWRLCTRDWEHAGKYTKAQVWKPGDALPELPIELANVGGRI